MLITSPTVNETYQRAEDEIQSNLSVGAITEYIDGDTALEYLGEILKMHQTSALCSAEHVDNKVGIYIQSIVDKIVENNVHFVAEQIARGV